MVVVGLIINWILWIFLLILFARMILSWVPVLVRDWEPRGPMLVFAEIIYSITDPPLRLLRKVLKPVRVGNMMLDLAFIGLAILVSILDAGQPNFVLLISLPTVICDFVGWAVHPHQIGYGRAGGGARPHPKSHLDTEVHDDADA